jgi:hypothetical protein
MAVVLKGYEKKLEAAVHHYWATLGGQAKKQAAGRDTGNRAAVTGGKQMDGFCELVRWAVEANGMPDASIYIRGHLEIPGYFRPTKRWDLLVVHAGHLVAAVEFKSQVGPSFGNNFNNRTEEALGNATDIWTAYREGAFGARRPRPWVGWLMFLEDCDGSAVPVRVDEPHFGVFREFRGSSYGKRYELLLRKLTLEKLYDGAALILSTRDAKRLSNYREPADDLSMKRFLAGLGGHIQTFLAST